ncbi:MAG TPA: HAD family hydrolase [Hellea balneolensis]|uniref:HAD family hydrolase n=1 Tax=Hellea balneolensis TaxID=287478 RepID=A0A7C3GBM9_9PROT|nr:HAD family hydrolase [Hellea balneolensis]
MTLKALIFDVDGTLCETEHLHLRAFNQAFQEAHLDWHWDAELYTELLKTTGGKERMRRYINEVVGQKPGAWADEIEKIHARKTAIYKQLVSEGGLALRPGMAALFKEAQDAGLKLAIATTTSAENVDILCRSLWNKGMADMFVATAAGDEVRLKKPTPDVFTLALERLGLPPENCIAFEDSRNGLLAALGANLTTIVVPSAYTKEDDFSKAHLLCDSYEQINIQNLAGFVAH